MGRIHLRNRPSSCPAWCALRHRQHLGNHDEHVGGALLVKRTVLRLCAAVDVGAGAAEPYVLVGSERYSLHEAEVLIGALTQLVEQASDLSPREGA